jgi:hypothetical protein
MTADERRGAMTDERLDEIRQTVKGFRFDLFVPRWAGEELLAEVDRLRDENAQLRENTARRCVEIVECNGLYVTPESDYWAGVRHGYATIAERIRREFGLENKA